MFIFSFVILVNSVAPVPTKREFLSFVASIYDPLGLLNPVIVKCKILFQKICLSKLKWDEKLSIENLNEWKLILNSLANVSSFHLPRWYLTDTFTNLKF